MKSLSLATLLSLMALGFCTSTMFAQESMPGTGSEQNGTSENASDAASDTAKKVAKTATDTVSEIAQTVDEDETAKEVSAGILQPIYQLAESMNFPMFHWVAFAVMVAGVVSFAAQLTLGKLMMLVRMHFSVMEILNDALGLVISLVGLVLTTQAAAENSTFTQSPAAVISSTAVGAVVGIVFYWHGQSQEIKAARAQRVEERKKK